MPYPNPVLDQCCKLFENVLAWLQETYHDHTFFVERDVVWTLQLALNHEIARLGLPLRVFNDYAIVKGPRRGLCADLAILDQANKVKVGAEFKYEPDHRRQDILQQKLPVVGWKDMEKDIARIRTFVEAGAIECGYTVFIDEGGFFRRREAHNGSNWVDWPNMGDRRSPAILFSRLTIPAPVIPQPEADMSDHDETADGDDDATSDDIDLDAKLREAEQTRRELEQCGWVWRGEKDIDKLLCHPDDPEVNVWFHPYSGEQLFSPKLVERLKREAQIDPRMLSD
jgi:hypothetical protein